MARIDKKVLTAAMIGDTAGNPRKARGTRDAWVARVGADGVQRVRIRCGPDFIDPQHIVLKANIPVEITVSTTDDLPAHTFGTSLAGASGSNANAANYVASTQGVHRDAMVNEDDKHFSFRGAEAKQYETFCRSVNGATVGQLNESDAPEQEDTDSATGRRGRGGRAQRNGAGWDERLERRKHGTITVVP